MFRCKECGSEFDIKPDYCDCGNDTFEEIVEKAEPVIEEKSIKKFGSYGNNAYLCSPKVKKNAAVEQMTL